MIGWTVNTEELPFLMVLVYVPFVHAVSYVLGFYITCTVSLKGSTVEEKATWFRLLVQVHITPVLPTLTMSSKRTDYYTQNDIQSYVLLTLSS
jgi:hypothetical protein